jgi:hypothetical protein
MSTPSLLDLVSANPEILGSATRPASAMGQIDPAPPAELVDAVSASPLEPFANPGAARQEPGEEPTMTQNVEGCCSLNYVKYLRDRLSIERSCALVWE